MEKVVKDVILSLLISMVFILSSVSAVFGDLGEVEASGEQDITKNTKEIASLTTYVERTTLNEDRLIANSCSSLGSCLCGIGDINLNPFMPQGTHDITLKLTKFCTSCMTCDVKLFCDVFMLNSSSDKIIYCTDFEDSADIYNNWESIDGTTDNSSGPGGIDTFTWTNKRSHSQTHSFHCTQFDDRYLGNQIDYLEFHLDNKGYDKIDLEFWHWCEGEMVDSGSADDIPEDYGEVLVSFDYGASWITWGKYYYDTEGEWKLIGNANEDTGALDVTGVSCIPEIWYRFKWVSGPVVQNEGWYIDDVCFYCPNIPSGEIVFQTHSARAVTLVDTFTEYTFPKQWVADKDGTYLFRIWMICETVECDVEYPQSDPLEFEIEIGGSATEIDVDAHGEYYGIVNEKIQLSGSVRIGVKPYTWHWDLGDGNTSEEQNPSHVYTSPGNHSVILTVTDDGGNNSCDTTFAWIQESNSPPEPPIIDGPSKGKPGEKYWYNFSAIDPDGTDVYLYLIAFDIDWGEWFGPYESGEKDAWYYYWAEKETYIIKAKAKDPYGAESDWGTLEVSTPKNKAINTPFLRFLENHPHLFPIIRQILEL